MKDLHDVILSIPDASSTAALGLAVPVERLLQSSAFAGAAKLWLALAAVVFTFAVVIAARR